MVRREPVSSGDLANVLLGDDGAVHTPEGDRPVGRWIGQICVLYQIVRCCIKLFDYSLQDNTAETTQAHKLQAEVRTRVSPSPVSYALAGYTSS